MTAQIHDFPATKRELDFTTFQAVSASCAIMEAIYPLIRDMREKVEKMEQSGAPLRADALTMLSRLATHLSEVETVIIHSRNTAAYCKTQLKEMGQ